MQYPSRSVDCHLELCSNSTSSLWLGMEVPSIHDGIHELWRAYVHRLRQTKGSISSCLGQWESHFEVDPKFDDVRIGRLCRLGVRRTQSSVVAWCLNFTIPTHNVGRDYWSVQEEILATTFWKKTSKTLKHTLDKMIFLSRGLCTSCSYPNPKIGAKGWEVVHCLLCQFLLILDCPW